MDQAADRKSDTALKELISGTEDDDFALAAEGFERFRRAVEQEAAPRERRRRFWKVAERVAAILLIPVAVSSALLLHAGKAGPVTWSEAYTVAGQTRTVTLCDGSTIRLGPQSHLIYPSTFDGEVRKVFLEGEAYADIAHIDGYPFEIRSEDITVAVYGTEFNFSSHLSDSECELLLVDGSVEIKIDGQDDVHAIRMKSGDGVRYDRSTGSVEKQRFSTDTYLANVHRGGLQFINRRLDDIAKCLERKFRATIVIEDETLAGERFFASFINGEDLPTILYCLNTQNHMNIKKKGDIYYLSLN